MSEHVHHIIPKHMTNGKANNHQDNLISLSIDEHAEAHKQLWLMYGHPEDEIAYLGLTRSISKPQAGLLASRTPKALAKWKKNTTEYMEKTWTPEAKELERLRQIEIQNKPEVKTKMLLEQKKAFLRKHQEGYSSWWNNFLD